MRTFTFMLSRVDDGEDLIERPFYVIGHPNATFAFTQLSMDGGGSPPFYWDAGGRYLMLDNWSQSELDAFASFHGVAGVSSLQLTDEEADALITLANSNTIRSTVPLPSTS
jgi:hypothetical protein